MRWCPECKAEYRPEFDTCPECHRALLEQNLEEVKSEPSAVLPILGNIVLYLMLLIVLGIWHFLTRNQPLGTTIILLALSIFGFVRGTHNWKHASIAIALFWLAYSSAAFISETQDGMKPGSLVGIAELAFVLAAPAIISAYLGSQWKRIGKQYLIGWIVFVAVLFCLPFVFQLVWP